ncbi:MAG: hypothetical protein ACJA1E_000416 [Paracoccaceae bacterium]|jgi:hypothetical protein
MIKIALACAIALPIHIENGNVLGFDVPNSWSREHVRSISVKNFIGNALFSFPKIYKRYHHPITFTRQIASINFERPDQVEVLKDSGALDNSIAIGERYISICQAALVSSRPKKAVHFTGNIV